MSDAVVSIVWCLVNGVLVVFAWRFANTFYWKEALALRITVALSVSIASIVTATVLLGALQLLHWVGVLAAVTCECAIGLWLLGLKTPSAEARALQCYGGQNALWSFWFFAWTAIAAFGVAHVALAGLLRFQTDFDSLMYHIPIVNQWIRAHSLYAPDSSYWWTPGTSETIGLWLVAPFSGDFLIGVNNLPFVVLWAAAVISFARQIGMCSGMAHSAALASLATYSTIHGMDDASNDMALVSICVACACFGLRFLHGGRRVDWYLCSVMLGVMCGVKYTALGYCALALLVFMVAICAMGGMALALRCLLIALAGVAIGGGYWYFRNWVIGGSPIYPMGIGEDIATGYPDVWSTTFVGNRDPRVPGLAASALRRMTGPVHTLAAICLPASIGVLCWEGWRNRTIEGCSAASASSRRALSSIVLCAFTLGSGALLLLTPFCLTDVPGTLTQLEWGYAQTRYGLCVLTFGVISLGCMCDRLSGWRLPWRHVCALKVGGVHCVAAWLGCKPRQVIMIMLTIAAIGWQYGERISYSSYEYEIANTWLLAGNIYACCALCVWLWFMVVRWVRVCVVVCCAAGCAAGVGALSERWHSGYGRFYDVFFECRVFETMQHIRMKEPICVVELRPYPFFGSRRQHRVIRPRIVASYGSLVKYMVTHNAQIIVTQADERYAYYLYTDVFRWVSGDPRHFRRLSEGGHFAVFRFNATGGDEVTTAGSAGQGWP